MAPFSRPLPDTNDPNYLGYSKGVEGPKPNLALAKLFSGLADTGESAIKGLDQMIEAKAEDAARKSIDNSDINGISLEDAAGLGNLKNKMFKGSGAGIASGGDSTGGSGIDVLPTSINYR
jgi:hypothetical protein